MLVEVRQALFTPSSNKHTDRAVVITTVHENGRTIRPATHKSRHPTGQATQHKHSQIDVTRNSYARDFKTNMPRVTSRSDRLPQQRRRRRRQRQRKAQQEHQTPPLYHTRYVHAPHIPKPLTPHGSRLSTNKTQQQWSTIPSTPHKKS